MRFGGIGLIGWIVIFVGAAIWEGIGLLSRVDDWPTITDLVRGYVPKCFILFVIVWLFDHFILTDA